MKKDKQIRLVQRPWVVRLVDPEEDKYYAIAAPSKNKAIWVVKRALKIPDYQFCKLTCRHPLKRELKSFEPTATYQLEKMKATEK